jgi:alpha-tubulin suppressor-like RCC1 family protein
MTISSFFDKFWSKRLPANESGDNSVMEDLIPEYPDKMTLLNKDSLFFPTNLTSSGTNGIAYTMPFSGWMMVNMHHNVSDLSYDWSVKINSYEVEPHSANMPGWHSSGMMPVKQGDIVKLILSSTSSEAATVNWSEGPGLILFPLDIQVDRPNPSVNYITDNEVVLGENKGSVSIIPKSSLPANVVLIINETLIQDSQGNIGIYVADEDADNIKIITITGERNVVTTPDYPVITYPIDENSPKNLFANSSAFIVLEDGIYACGYNDKGQLGSGNLLNQTVFNHTLQIPPNRNVKKMMYYHNARYALALLDDSTLYAVGNNMYGQLGLGNTTDRTTFTQVTNLPDDIDIEDIDIHTSSVYYRSSILTNNGTLWVAGNNAYGQLGLGNKTNQTSWVKVTSIPEGKRITKIRDSAANTTILLDDGSLWQSGNHYGVNGGSSTEFVQVDSLPSDRFVRDLLLSTDNTIYGVILDNGLLYVTGSNKYGQLGVGNSVDQPSYVRVGSLPVDRQVIKVISTTTNNTFVLLDDGTLWATGTNGNGQLGLGNTAQRTSLTKVTSIPNTNIKQIRYENTNTFILLDDNTLWSTGHNAYGQLGLGDNTDKALFTQVTNLPSGNIKEVVCGNTYSFILLEDGSLWGTGQNYSGQLGLGDNTNRNTFTKVTTLPVDRKVKEISIGENTIFVLLDDGSIWGCGANTQGQLGLGHTDIQTSFVPLVVKI